MSKNVILLDGKWQVSIWGPSNTVINVFNYIFLLRGLIFFVGNYNYLFLEHWALNPVLATLHTLMTAVNSWVQLSYVFCPKPNYIVSLVGICSPYTRVVSWKVYRKSLYHRWHFYEGATKNELNHTVGILSFTYLFQIWQLSDCISTFLSCLVEWGIKM